MKYSRNKINQSGKVLLAGPEMGFPYTDANLVVEDWRKLHMIPLQELVEDVTRVLADGGVQAAFSSHRLKRMTSIIAKLRHNPGMGLGGLQDIGGARFVFEDIDSLLKAQKIISQASFEHFVTDREPYDYVVKPKASGYRSIHFTYKFVSDNDDYDGLRVELQIRTRLQHDWAMAVETAELISKSSLKASLGDENWLSFFKLSSAVFAQKEGMPVAESFAEYSEKDYCLQYAQLDKSFKFLDQLQALVSAVKISEEHTLRGGFAVLLIQFAEKRVQLRHFQSDNLEDATKYYSEVEKSINDQNSAVVLVSVSDMKELQEAYPSYFLNASEFIQALFEFNSICKTKQYI
ncbi:MAG: RelA/SpoT domain-containing protein [Candidatus Cryptobacteroides sp.]|nr:RelA/SpoT domain-containing protein [Candidatus Cryptobacteroides sp.]